MSTLEGWAKPPLSEIAREFRVSSKADIERLLRETPRVEEQHVEEAFREIVGAGRNTSYAAERAYQRTLAAAARWERLTKLAAAFGVEEVPK